MIKRCFWKSLVSRSENSKESRRIKEEFSKGYWHDFKVLNSTGGKFYEPKNKLHLEIKVPDIVVMNLESKRRNLHYFTLGRPILLGVVFNEFGNTELQTYKTFFDQNLKGMGISYVHLSVEETWLKSMVLRSMVPSLRSKIPKKEHTLYLLSVYKKIYDFKEELDIRNKYVPWVYLINNKGIVRWTIHGKPTETELKLLERMAQKIVKE
eukprot:NODE_347_length_10448_cov_0.163687.p6 type:complete len:209 gc:universal NODE_347_length_10448_cov_0.163687:5385-6011(+)